MSINLESRKWQEKIKHWAEIEYELNKLRIGDKRLLDCTLTNPLLEFADDAKAGKFEDLPIDEYEKEAKRAEYKSMMWFKQNKLPAQMLMYNAMFLMKRKQAIDTVANILCTMLSRTKHKFMTLDEPLFVVDEIERTKPRYDDFPDTIVPDDTINEHVQTDAEIEELEDIEE